MKVILDCPPGNMGAALQAIFQTQRETPELAVGKSKRVTANGQTFTIRRNYGSYTAEQK